MSINVHTQPFSPKPSILQIPEYTRSLQVNQTIKCICITFIHICSRSLVSHLDLHFPPRFLYIFISPLSPAYDVSNDYKVVKIESHTSKDKSSSVILLLSFKVFSRWENTESLDFMKFCKWTSSTWDLSEKMTGLWAGHFMHTEQIGRMKCTVETTWSQILIVSQIMSNIRPLFEALYVLVQFF